MEDRSKIRPDGFVTIACGAGALVMTALTAGAADVRAHAALLIFLLMGIAPYGLTVVLSAIRPLRRLILAATRAVAVVYGTFDCGLRYVALYHPQSSTDAVVVAILPFWWLPTLLVVTAIAAAALWLRSRATGRPAFA